MNKAWNWLVNLYQTNAKFRGFAQAVEGGAITGLLMATTNGFDLSKKGLTALAAAIVGGVIAAVRNYLVNRPGQPAMPEPPLPPPVPIDAPKTQGEK